MGANGQGHLEDSPRIAALRAKVSAAEAARDAAKAAITDEDRAEIDLRKTLARADEERRAEEKTKRDIDLLQREEAARELHPNAKIKSLAVQNYDDTFILMHVPKAHAKWKKDLHDALMGNKKLDSEEINRAFAVAVVIDWNGNTDFGMTSLNGHALIEFLKKATGIVSLITNEAIALAGGAAEERKSG